MNTNNKNNNERKNPAMKEMTVVLKIPLAESKELIVLSGQILNSPTIMYKM